MKHLPYTRYKKLVIVCTNERAEGVCCKRRGSEDLFVKLKAEVKKTRRFVRVIQSRCLGHCLAGTTIVIMPDNIWLSDVKEEDIPEILKLLS